MFFWYTPCDDLIRTILEKVRFFLKEEPYLGKEAIYLASSIQKLLVGKVIDDVRIPGFLKNSLDVFIWEIFVDWNFLNRCIGNSG